MSASATPTPTPTSATTSAARRPDRDDTHERRTRQILAFKVHAAIFAVSSLANFAINLLVNLNAGIVGDLSAWWSLYALIGWGLGIAIHGLVVWVAMQNPDT